MQCSVQIIIIVRCNSLIILFGIVHNFNYYIKLIIQNRLIYAVFYFQLGLFKFKKFKFKFSNLRHFLRNLNSTSTRSNVILVKDIWAYAACDPIEFVLGFFFLLF